MLAVTLDLSPAAWWALLAAALTLSGLHLASMLSTRWGDRAAGPKSFVFSVVAHVGLICLVFAVKPSLDRMLGERGPSPTEPERRFQVGSIRADAAEDPARDRIPEPWRSDAAPTPTLPERSAAPERSDTPAPDLARTPRPDRPLEEAAPLAEPDPAPDRPRPDRPAAEPEALAAVAPAPAAEMEPVAVPDEPAPAAPAEPRPTRAARRDAGEPAPSAFLPIRPKRPREDRTEAPAALADAPDRPFAPRVRPTDPEAGPRPVPPTGPTPGGVAAAPAPAVPVDAEEPAETTAAARPARRPRSAADDEPALAAGPVRTRRDRDDGPEPAAGLAERPFAPGMRRPRRDADDGPRAVASAASEAAAPAPGVPDAYKLRDLTRRSEIARRYGGTAESEEAVEAALAWFARTQTAAGFWDGSEHGSGRGGDDDPAERPDPDQRNTGRDADTGLTGMVTLSFLGAGYTRANGRYAPAVDRAVRWLVAQQKPDGSLGGEANYYARMYSHGIATYALAEALALEGDRPDPALRDAVRRAVAYTVDQQYPDGGWRYSQRAPQGDVSMFGWQCMALKSAENAGVPIPAEVRSGMVRFVRARSLTRTAEGRLVQANGGGLGQYMPDPPGYPIGSEEPVTPAMTAELLFCKQMLGLRRDRPAAVEAVAYLDAHPPGLRSWNLYHWYYATLALHAHGGPEWERWNGELRDLLLSEQYATGPAAGTWPVRPNGQDWAEYGGRLYTTAMATLCLEVYYRFSPAAGGAAAMDGRAD